MSESANFHSWRPRTQWVTHMEGVFIDPTYVPGDGNASVHVTPAITETMDVAIQAGTDIPRILRLFTDDPSPAQLAEGYWIHESPESL